MYFEDPTQVETYVSKNYSRRNEWYQVDLEDLIIFIKNCKEIKY